MTDNRKKCISFALFGYDKQRYDGCLDFNSYLRGISINARLARLVYPDFEVVVNTDAATYEAFKTYFDAMPIRTLINDPAPLTKAMLWRLKPIFETLDGKWRYSHVICRDLDGAVSYREAQAVQYWMNKDKAMHCITDSISHSIPCLGGMIGFKPDYITERIGRQNWNDLMNVTGYQWDVKGMDQTFINHEIYPWVAQHGSDSVTQHYIKGMPHSFLSDCHNEIQDIEVQSVPFEYKCTNDCVVHIGQCGWNEMPTLNIFRKYADLFADITEAEKQFPNIFYWVNQ